MKLLAERFDLETGELIARPARRITTRRACASTTDPQTDHKPAGRSRGPDLLKLLDEAHQLAADGQAIVPREVGADPRRPRRPPPILLLAPHRPARAHDRSTIAASELDAARPSSARPRPHRRPRPRHARPRRPGPHRLQPTPPTSPTGANIWPRSMSFINADEAAATGRAR